MDSDVSYCGVECHGENEECLMCPFSFLSAAGAIADLLGDSPD